MRSALSRQTFGGARLRQLRLQRHLSQRQLASLLGISVSYLSQMESDDRPITTSVLDALAREMPGEWALVDTDGDATTLVRAGQAASDPAVAEPLPTDAATQRVLSRHPAIARRLIALHDAVAAGQGQLRALDDRIDRDGGDRRHLPWEEARDWFHDQSNYVDAIDCAAEKVADTLDAGTPVEALAGRLRERFGVVVVASATPDAPLRDFDPATRRLGIDPSQPTETTAFSLAHLLARLEFPDVADEIAGLGAASDAARQLLLAGLANYAAGALLMPYRRFHAAAGETRHDIDRLRRRFGTSFEQTCHRLSTLQRPGARGVPFFFCRIDMAGNITKRHSATRLQFAQFGGGCPLWVVHEAVAIPDRILVQLAETPDRVRYVSMAKGLVKSSGNYSRPPRRYAVALGCEVEHAADFIYADGLQISGAATPIGISCRICPRSDCAQRAFPPLANDIHINLDRRGAVAYEVALPSSNPT